MIIEGHKICSFPQTYANLRELTEVGAQRDCALVVDFVAEVAPEQLQRLCLVRQLVLAGPVVFVDVGDALHQRLRGGLHLASAGGVVLQLFLQAHRRSLLLGEVVLVDFEQLIGGAVLLAKVLQKLVTGEREGGSGFSKLTLTKQLQTNIHLLSPLL